MTRMYLRLIPDVYARKMLGRSKRGVRYSPSQFAAFIGCLCAAEAVSPRGRFASKAQLVGTLAGDALPLAKVSKDVQFLIQQGDLEVLEDGSVYVEGWDELQEGRDPTVNDRMRRYRGRDRRQNGVTRNADVTVPLSAVGRRPEALHSNAEEIRVKPQHRATSMESASDVLKKMVPHSAGKS